MNTKIGASTVIGTLLALLGYNTAAHAQLDVQQKLAQIDRTFVCPESLPSDEARTDALKLFVEQVAAVQPIVTVKQLTEYRDAVLRKHQCRATLAQIGVAPAVQPTPATRNTDHWERAGSISGPSGMVITVDMDSMTSAGPSKMRT
jgi:hypothetical protein